VTARVGKSKKNEGAEAEEFIGVDGMHEGQIPNGNREKIPEFLFESEMCSWWSPGRR
jgi:hypothetical protein